MTDVDVQQFISSSRAKLSEEKMRMIQERIPREIVPSGSKALVHTARLRNERQSEYRDYIKSHGSTKSIAERRREMALERDKELSSHSDSSLVRNRDVGMDYGSLKERRMAEERRYRHSDSSEHRRGKWEDSKPSVTFKQEQSDKMGDWDSDERDLVSWAKPQQHVSQQTPAPHSHRSISAPTYTVGGITSLGAGDNNLETKRSKQKQYADSLKDQMKGKIEPKRSQRFIEEERSPVNVSQPRSQHLEPRSHYEPPPPMRQQQLEQSAPRSHYEPPPPMRQQHYPPYQSMYYPPPPPHPPPHPYYMPSYYPPPPPRDMYHYPERPDPYRHPYYPPANPYLPPHVPAHVTRPGDEQIEPRHSQRERDSEFRPSNDRMENRKSHDSHTSPIHGDSTRGSKGDKMSYRRELERQMKDKKERQLKAKIAKEKYELKQENEIYDPFGKGGCGAPVRDQAGNVVADLKRLKRINDERLGVSPRQSVEFVSESEESLTRQSSDKISPRNNKTVLMYNKMDDEVQKKENVESYRDYLRRQVREKEEEKQKLKEAEKLQEMKEMDRLEKDRLKSENDLKMDRTRERLTEVELKRKNEELKKEAELRRKEYTMKQREMLYQKQLQEKLLAEQKLQALADKMAQQQDNPLLQPRSHSPPIPTLRKQREGNPQQQRVSPQQQGEIPQQVSSQSPPVPTLHKKMVNPQRSNSPPVPTIQRKQSIPPTVPTPQATAPTVSEPPVTPATESSILTQLAAMRMHLQAQLAQTSETSSQAPKQSIVPPPLKAGPRVRQPQASTLNTNIEKFSSLKYKTPFPNQELLSQFPNPPRSDSALSVQQGAMLRYQEEKLARMRNREQQPATSIGGQLPSFSEGVPLSSSRDPFREARPPRPTQDLLSVSRGRPSAVRNTSAGGQSQYSIATVDVDGMAGRNEDRMRRLDAILNAGTQSYSAATDVRRRDEDPSYSAATNVRRDVRRMDVDPVRDSESIISNFLQRTSGQPSLSRGSERSLECDTAYQRLATPNT